MRDYLETEIKRRVKGFDMPELKDKKFEKGSIDDVMQTMIIPGVGSYRAEKPISYARRDGDYGLGDVERIAKGYGITSNISSQYGMKGQKPKYHFK